MHKNNIFDRTEILTVATYDQAVIGEKGFFSDSFVGLYQHIEDENRFYPKALQKINENSNTPFYNGYISSTYFYPWKYVRKSLLEQSLKRGFPKDYINCLLDEMVG